MTEREPVFALRANRYIAIDLDSGGYVSFDLLYGRRVGRVTERWSAAAWLAAKLNRDERRADAENSHALGEQDVATGPSGGLGTAATPSAIRKDAGSSCSPSALSGRE